MAHMPFGDPSLSPALTGLVALLRVTDEDRSSIGSTTLAHMPPAGKEFRRRAALPER
jgi:hypothetical protein